MRLVFNGQEYLWQLLMQMTNNLIACRNSLSTWQIRDDWFVPLNLQKIRKWKPITDTDPPGRIPLPAWLGSADIIRSAPTVPPLPNVLAVKTATKTTAKTATTATITTAKTATMGNALTTPFNPLPVSNLNHLLLPQPWPLPVLAPFGNNPIFPQSIPLLHPIPQPLSLSQPVGAGHVGFNVKERAKHPGEYRDDELRAQWEQFGETGPLYYFKQGTVKQRDWYTDNHRIENQSLDVMSYRIYKNNTDTNELITPLGRFKNPKEFGYALSRQIHINGCYVLDMQGYDICNRHPHTNLIALLFPETPGTVDNNLLDVSLWQTTYKQRPKPMLRDPTIFEMERESVFLRRVQLSASQLQTTLSDAMTNNDLSNAKTMGEQRVCCAVNLLQFYKVCLFMNFFHNRYEKLIKKLTKWVVSNTEYRMLDDSISTNNARGAQYYMELVITSMNSVA